ncbi:MAG: HAD family hydrolase [Syntrophobacteraceae bacterium]
MTSSNALQAVVFDCDGILVDTEPLHYQAFQEVLKPLGLGFDYDRYLERYIGFDDRDAFREAFREGQRPLGSGALEQLMLQKAEALLRLVERGVESFPGVVELVRELTAKGVPLAVASGALRQEVILFVKALGLLDAFPVVVAADDVARSKPDPETYLLAVERLGALTSDGALTPRYCVAIEDTVTGIESARRAGLVVLGVANSYPADELKPHADCVVESLAEVGADKLSRLALAAKR